MIKLCLAATAAILFVCCASQAAPAEGLASAILSCSAQPDGTSQLACYNQIAARLKTSATPAGQSSAGDSVSPPQTAAQAPGAQQGNREGSWYDVGSWFGSSNPPPPGPARQAIGTPADFGKAEMPFEDTGPVPLDHITAKVADVSYNFFRHFTVTLDNGQVWRQTDEDTSIAHFKTDTPVTVKITRGFLDTFHLSIDGVWARTVLSESSSTALTGLLWTERIERTRLGGPIPGN